MQNDNNAAFTTSNDFSEHNARVAAPYKARNSPELARDMGRSQPNPEIAKTIGTTQDSIVFESFQSALNWSEENDGKPFTRTNDGYYFTPTDENSGEIMAQSFTRLVA